MDWDFYPGRLKIWDRSGFMAFLNGGITYFCVVTLAAPNPTSDLCKLVMKVNKGTCLVNLDKNSCWNYPELLVPQGYKQISINTSRIQALLSLLSHSGNKPEVLLTALQNLGPSAVDSQYVLAILSHGTY